MDKKIQKLKDEFIEVVDTTPTEYIEENVYIDEALIKNKELIRMDMNIIQFPIFSKNTQRKVNQVVTYYFNENRATYIKVTPSAGDYIPGELEERVFIALMQIMKERGMPREFLVTSVELREKLNLNFAKYNNKIKNSLIRLATTNYAFKNTLYSSEYKGIIGEEVLTTMFSLRILTLSLKENKKYRDKINDKRIKEIYEIKMTEHFYKNIIQKGYMVYNGNTLLEISSSVARTIYMLIEKLRFDNLYLKLDTIFLIKRIPLKYDKRNLSQTIKTLEKSFQELIEKNLISSFNFIKEKTWAKSEIEIFFNIESNEEKQNRFYYDRNDFRKVVTALTISNTEHDIIEEDINLDKKVTKEMVEKILNLMPTKAKDLKTMPKTIKEAIEEYGYNKVEQISIYMKQQKVEKVRAYFLKALKENWIPEKIELEKPIKTVKTPVQFTIEDNIPKYNENYYIEFEKLPMEIQNGIENYAYQDYVKQCGMNTKIQQIAFAGSRKKYICEFLEKHPEILGNSSKDEIEEIEVKKVEYLTSLEDIKKIINRTLEMASMVNNYNEDEKTNILKIIIRELMDLIQDEKLTTEILKETLNKYTGF